MTENTTPQDLGPTVNAGTLTISTAAPLQVTTSAATSVAATTATLNGSITNLGSDTSVTASFEYGTTTSYGSTTSGQTKTATGAYTADITGLTANTTYHYRAKVVGTTTVTGDDQTFTTTSSGALTVSTSAATSVTSTTATLNGSLSNLGGNSSAAVNFEYGTTTGYGSTTTAQTMTATGSFLTNLTGLTANTTYHYRAKAVGTTTVTGSDQTFTTTQAGAISISTLAATNLSQTGATLNGNLASLGNDTSVSVSFEYGTTTSYGSTTTAQTMTATGNYQTGITSLTAGTTYHYRAKAVGTTTVNGSDQTFTTTQAGTIGISTSAATNLSQTGATLNGNLTSLGNDTSVLVSFEYGTSTGYGSTTTGQTKTVAGTYTSDITGLTAGTTYHYRAKAVGTSTVNGSDQTFTTQAAATTTTPATTTPPPTTTQTSENTTVRQAQNGRRTTTPPAVTPPQNTTKQNIQVSGDNVLDLSTVVDRGGVITSETQFSNIRISTFSKISSINIKKDTRAMTTDGQLVTSIGVVPASMSASAPRGSQILNSFEFEPSGTIFSQPITVTFQYESAQLPAGINSKNLTLQYYNDDTGKWEPCDFTLDVPNSLITAKISHFSLYALIAQGGSSAAGVGWNMAYLIILTEIIAGGILVYFFLQRRRKPAVVPVAAAAAPPVQAAESPALTPRMEPAAAMPARTVRESATIVWNDILNENMKKGSSFKTQVEIIGGKVSIPQPDGLPLEIINTVDTRLIVSLEYDPELYPKGNARIIVLNSEQYKKSKEYIK